MCRIGAIKSKVPVEPAKALYLMLPQQEGHDNSGYAMVMQDLYGVFEGHKDKPLLSLACTPRGVRMVDAYMAEQGFEQVLEWLPDVDRRPGLDIKAMPCYVFRNYEYPEAYRGRPQAEREELLLDTRLALRRMLEKDGQGFVYSFWPDVLTLKEIGDRSSPTRNFLMRPASWGVSFYPDTQSLLSEQKATSTQYRRISATGNAAERDSIRPKASGREGPGKKTFSREASPPIPFFLTGNTMPAGRTASPVR